LFGAEEGCSRQEKEDETRRETEEEERRRRRRRRETEGVTQRSTMKVLRTPEERFAKLPADYACFATNYIEIPAKVDDNDDIDPQLKLRMHYIDEGSRDGEPVLMLHGEPRFHFHPSQLKC